MTWSCCEFGSWSDSGPGFGNAIGGLGSGGRMFVSLLRTLER